MSGDLTWEKDEPNFVRRYVDRQPIYYLGSYDGSLFVAIDERHKPRRCWRVRILFNGYVKKTYEAKSLDAAKAIAEEHALKYIIADLDQKKAQRA